MIELETKGLISAAEWLDSLFRDAGLFAFAVIALRLIGSDELEFQGMKFRVRHYRVLAVILTLAHLFLAVVFVESCRRLVDSPALERRRAWQELTVAGPLLFRGMEPRLRTKDLPLPFIGRRKVYLIENADLAGWLSLILATLVGLSTADYRLCGWRARLLSLAPGALLAAVNWVIGGWWAVTASGLARP
jgi:hypothetical protein